MKRGKRSLVTGIELKWIARSVRKQSSGGALRSGATKWRAQWAVWLATVLAVAAAGGAAWWHKQRGRCPDVFPQPRETSPAHDLALSPDGARWRCVRLFRSVEQLRAWTMSPGPSDHS